MLKKKEGILMSDYTKFKGIYDEIDELIKKKVDSSTPEFQAWKVKTERFLIKKYGEKSYELNNFKGYPFSLTLYTFDTTKSQFIEACAEDLKAVKAIFANYLEDMQEDNGDFENDARKSIYTNSYKKVFIVHGHDAELKEATARLIERQGIKPIILHEQANKGATIIEKIEANSDVQAAICLFTADDVGKGKKEEKDNIRARQNVVFETGYFIGKLGRKNIVIVSESGIELPSDLQGVVYTNTLEWKFSLLKELRAIGYQIDYNKIEL